jgi:hypothetical protein
MIFLDRTYLDRHAVGWTVMQIGQQLLIDGWNSMQVWEAEDRRTDQRSFSQTGRFFFLINQRIKISSFFSPLLQFLQRFCFILTKNVGHYSYCEEQKTQGISFSNKVFASSIVPQDPASQKILKDEMSCTQRGPSAIEFAVYRGQGGPPPGHMPPMPYAS